MNLKGEIVEKMENIKNNQMSIIGSIIYVISPIDTIDIIPVLGWGDDMTVIGVVMASIAATVADYKKHKGLE